MGFPVENESIRDPTRQAQESFFSRKTTKKIHPKIFFNNIPVSKAKEGIRQNNNKVDYIETKRIDIAELLP